MTKVLVTRAIFDTAQQLLIDAVGAHEIDTYEVDQIIPHLEFLKRIQGKEAVLTMLTEQFDEEAMDAAGSHLKVIANCAVGYNNIDVEAATQRGIKVTNTPDVLTESTADLAWALILGAGRRTGEAERCLREGKWTSWSPTFMMGSEIHGKTLGIFGMGRIGQAVARRAQGFNMPVLYHSRNRVDESIEHSLNARYVDFPTLLSKSDVISIHCPFSDKTLHTFASAEFQQMKSTATLINTSRGPVVDERALANALRNGEIAHVGLDVYEKEPQVHPDLLKCENALLLPHIGSATLDTRTAMAELAARNIAAHFNNQPLLTCVNP
jgi:glyoxylate reductase